MRAKPLLDQVRGHGLRVLYGLAIVLVLAVFLLVPTAVQPALWELVAFGSAAAIVAGVVLHRPERPEAWLVFGAAMLANAIGDLLWDVLYTWGSAEEGALGPPDALYLVSYPLFAIALVLFVRAQRSGGAWSWGALLDAAILITPLCALAWSLLIKPVVDAGELTGLNAVQMVYPVADLVLIAVLIWLALTGCGKTLSFVWLFVGFALLLPADTLTRDLLLAGEHDMGESEGLFYLGAYAAWGLAALHPSMRLLAEAGPPDRERLTRRRIAFLGVASIATPLMLIGAWGDTGGLADSVVLVVAAVLVPVLVLVRLAGVVRVAEAMSSSAEAARRNLADVLHTSPLPIVVIDLEERATLWNKACEEMWGWSEQEVVGQRVPLQAATEEDRARGEQLQRDMLAGKPASAVELTLLTRSGKPVDVHVWTTPLLDDAGRMSGTVLTSIDVTERNRQEAEIRYLAGHDPLTGLPNRRFFEQAIAETVRRPPGGSAALLILDLDNFKLVNDTAGHQTGDRLLRAVAGLLRESVRPGDLVGRLGGDEFGILLHRVSVSEARDICDRILRAASEFRFESEGYVFDLGISIGLAPITSSSSSSSSPPSAPEAILARADAALYQAKYEGKNRVVVRVDPVLESVTAAQATRLAARVKDALRDNRLVLELQPIVHLESGSVAFHEALVRLRDEHGELLPPAAFLPTADRFGLMPAIDSFIVENAVRLLEDDPKLRIFVNLAGSSLTDDSLLKQIQAGIRLRVPGGRLGFEITEAAAVKDLEQAKKRLGALAELGCPIAIDDFGTGFSSFSHLKLLPAEYVKIGSSFIRDLERDEASRGIARAITEVAHVLGKKVIAEAVERESTRRTVADLGIEYAQGFLLGEPQIPASWARIVQPPRFASAS